MTYRFYEQWFLTRGLELVPDTEVATTDQILPLVKCELGLAFVPEPMVRQAIRQGGSDFIDRENTETICLYGI